jgi:hypothetical protein
MAKIKHRFSFFRAGGVDQVVLASGADLAHVDELDQKLWLALSCPTRGLEFDSRTLDLIDGEHDGHIRPSEILATVRWAKEAFANLDDLFRGEGKVALSAINAETEVGKQLLAESKAILASLGRGEADSISLDDVANTETIMAATRFNGDGVLPAESAGDDAIAQAIRDIVTTMGGKPDRSGKQGVDQATVDAFFDQARVYVDWLDQGKEAEPAASGTAAAADAIAAVKVKVDDYFARCRLASFDARAAAKLNPAEEDFAALAPRVLTSDAEEIAKLPLAPIAAGRALPLADGLNPAWAARIATLASAAVRPMLMTAKGVLTESEWNTLQDRMAGYRAWQSVKPTTSVSALPPARLRELVSGTFRADIGALVLQDTASGDRGVRLEQVERMIRLHRDLVRLLRNFVNFSEFYGTRKAIFQTGTLYIDGRSCDLCLPVDDAARHSTLAGLAKAYLLYCDCTRKSGEKRSIVAAVTGGMTDNLMVGRNGVFWDRKGNDWDATVTRIVENPIGIRQAFWSPYKRFVRMVEEQVGKRLSAAEQDSQRKAEAVATDTAHADKAAVGVAGKDKKEEPKKIDVGTVAAIGVAVGGLATFLSTIFAMFLGLGVWIPLGLLALLLAISGPSMLIAWLKLRQRNVGPILDANGWSVNAMAKINVPFGAALTQVAVLPRGARRELRDPFAERKRPWKLYIVLVALLVIGTFWALGRLDAHLPPHLQSPHHWWW